MKPRAYYQPYQSGLAAGPGFSPPRRPAPHGAPGASWTSPSAGRSPTSVPWMNSSSSWPVNDALRALRSRKDMVILLNEEGALIPGGLALVPALHPQPQREADPG